MRLRIPYSVQHRSIAILALAIALAPACYRGGDQAHADEARHQQEVPEEADIGDVRRDPADQDQLDEQHDRARQEEADGGSIQRADRLRDRRGEPIDRARSTLSVDHPVPILPST